MRILLVHPEDSPRRGPWSQQRWDLLVDLGKSSAVAAEEWSHQYGCPVLRTDALRQVVSDYRLVRTIFSAGRGRLLDREGIDWWDLTSLLLAPETLEVMTLERVAAEISASAELWSTRPGGPARILALLLGRDLRTFRGGVLARLASRAIHYSKLLRHFSAPQIKEILLDKYDSRYRWRARFATGRAKRAGPVVLIPSAYQNVSQMAAAYAGVLPEQKFLMVVTRQNAKRFVAPSNVEVEDLAAYVKLDAPERETASMLERWVKQRADLSAAPELRTLAALGALDPVPHWIRDGLNARDAWRQVMESEPVCGVLCGDDSNQYTLLPVLLAARRNIPTVDFHHGAFDGRYLLKQLPCDIYIAKSEVERDYLVRVCGLPDERIVMGAPSEGRVQLQGRRGVQPGTSAIFFSEPYESAGMRPEEIYRELLPSLCRVARNNGRSVIVKLHPFENLSQRNRMINDIVDPADRGVIRAVAGPLNDALMAQAWFGITVESTTVMDCLRNGIRCFLCGWLRLTQYGYLDQYARFGIGEVLQSRSELEDLAERLEKAQPAATSGAFPDRVDPALLQLWLTTGQPDRASARPAS